MVKKAFSAKGIGQGSEAAAANTADDVDLAEHGMGSGSAPNLGAARPRAFINKGMSGVQAAPGQGAARLMRISTIMAASTITSQLR